MTATARVCSRWTSNPCPIIDGLRQYMNGWYCLAHVPDDRPPASGIPGTLRVLVTGSRTWDEPARVHAVLDALLTLAPAGLTVVHGACPRGADAHASAWARDHTGDGVTEEPHPADWSALGRAAGPARNTAMVALGADRCAAFIRDHSPGASHCARAAQLAAIPTHRYTTTTSRPAAVPARKDHHMTDLERLKAAALAYAARGWHVFPLVPGQKRPAVTGWEKRATTDPDRILRCWDHGPYNIGIACGPSKLVVVDLDTAKADEAPKEEWARENASCGADVLAVLSRRAGADYPDDTYTVDTPSGGTHLYFAAPDGPALRNTAGTLGWKVDTRANGGYVVAAASTVDTRPYTATADDADPAPLPGWLHTLLRPRPPRTAPETGAPRNTSAYADAALRGEIANVAGAGKGGRNTALYEAARNLGKFVAFDDLTRAEVENRLLSAGLAAGLTEAEAVPAIRNALDYSIARYPHGREAA